MIQTIDLYKSFGDLQVLKGINEHVAPREVISIIGPSGGGKSTFLRILSGQLETTSGNVSITEGQRLSFLEQDHNKYDSQVVLDTVIQGNSRLYEIMQEKDALYAKEDFSDEDGLKASELEAEFAEMDGWEDGNKRSLLVPDATADHVMRYRNRPVVYGDDTELTEKALYVGNFKALGTLFVRKGIEMATTSEILCGKLVAREGSL